MVIFKLYLRHHKNSRRIEQIIHQWNGIACEDSTHLINSRMQSNLQFEKENVNVNENENNKQLKRIHWWLCKTNETASREELSIATIDSNNENNNDS